MNRTGTLPANGAGEWASPFNRTAPQASLLVGIPFRALPRPSHHWAEVEGGPVLAEGLGKGEHGGEVDVEHLLPIRKGHFLGWPANGHAASVDKYVDLAMGLRPLGELGIEGFGLVQIHGNDFGFDPVFEEGLLCGIQGITASGGDNDTGADFAQFMGDGQTDPPASARYPGAFSG